MDLLYETNPLADVETADTRSLSKAIDAASWSAFLQVPFDEWVLKAAGRNAHLVDTFLWYHKMLSVRLYYRLRRCSEAQKVKSDLQGRTYHRQRDNDEMAEFQINISLFHGIHHTLPGLLASSMTENDLRSFRDNYALMFVEVNGLHKWLGALGHSWNC
ncbi:hypothetical protein RJZ90_007039 [Blastomyces dermatitidis]